MIGAEQGGNALARQIHGNLRLDYRIIGFLDEDRTRHGSRLGGIPFLATPADAVQVAGKHNVRDLLVVSHSIPGKRLRELVEECRHAGIHVKMVPPVDELLNESSPFQIRSVNISDLLQRDPVQLDDEQTGEMLKGCRVMVTGAGGSIGSEICRQILRQNPERLVLVERAENTLFFMEQELQRFPAEAMLFSCIADVRRPYPDEGHFPETPAANRLSRGSPQACPSHGKQSGRSD